MKSTMTGLSIMFAAALLAGCGTGSQNKQDRDFFTSGNREADQRAEQRVAKSQQVRGKEGEKSEPARQSLYIRLGGEPALTAIVDDFVTRVLADPRVNWTRRGVTKGGLWGMGVRSAEWKPDPEAVDTLKLHLRQFLALATGGPSSYEGKSIKESHSGMRITNDEFDASVGDLKATLDKLGVAAPEQKELISLVESTRAQIVERR